MMKTILDRTFKVIMVVVFAPFALAANVTNGVWTLYKGIWDIIKGK